MSLPWHSLREYLRLPLHLTLQAALHTFIKYYLIRVKFELHTIQESKENVSQLHQQKVATIENPPKASRSVQYKSTTYSKRSYVSTQVNTPPAEHFTGFSTSPEPKTVL